MRRIGIYILLSLFPAFLLSQTVVSPVNYAPAELECLNQYVDFPDGERWFSGLQVRQGTRLYYLDNPYKIEVLTGRIVFDDYDAYTDRVTVFLANTVYVDMEEFKAAATMCIPGAGAPSGGIDSISHIGDTLYVYETGNPVPYQTYLPGCPCEAPPVLFAYCAGDYESDEAAILGGVAEGETYCLTIDNIYGMPEGTVKQLGPYFGHASDMAAVTSLGYDVTYSASASNIYGAASGMRRIPISSIPTYQDDADAASNGVEVGEFYAWDSISSGHAPFLIKRRLL